MRLRATLAALLILALAGCTGAPGGAHGEAAGAGPVRLDTSLGRVEIPEAADRVVALDWVYAEELVSVGITPVGVADVAGYAASRPVEPLPEGVTDVGPRRAPSPAAIAALDPDLVVGTVPHHRAGLAELEAIAPTLLFEPHPTQMTALEEMAATLRTIGAAVGRREDAERMLVELEEAVAAARARLGPLPDREVTVAAPTGGTRLRVYADSSLPGQVLAEIGLSTPWSGADGANDVTVGPEELAAAPDTTVLFAGDEDALAALGEHPGWQERALPRPERTVVLGLGVPLAGGPASAVLLVERVSAALGGRPADPG